ncbi:Ribosomal RNA small subunit methyltransferase E [Arenibacter antarcticus]|uniref:Ribosomal RNA small subunit methyltransferase E n=1 Tax=Arenibacter antarcticus TaxID=2040469 RepID=A0ABW5VFY2_9FLAO|nr:16S rRNA (uracil(1498)-N(3))-methyltransferase [Arenibacter sp. H213]MCM4167298.1 16S rRNA (uracil(1498)-N(3))-methyltransferase [Arenibacter sp. H213]
MQLFFHPDLNDATNEFSFPTDESKHIAKVLRKKTGDILWITNGNGILFEAEITNPNPKKCEGKVISKVTNPPKPYRLHMVVAPTKLNDRFEWFLEKATEIGVHEITPVICDHSERKIIKKERMEKVLQAAMKQSLQTYLPKLNDAISLSEFLKTPTSGELFIAHCEDQIKKELFHSLTPHKNTTILIGPEGDFSSAEIKLALANAYNPIALGETRLRTETAAVVACTTVAMVNLIR